MNMRLPLADFLHDDVRDECRRDDGVRVAVLVDALEDPATAAAAVADESRLPLHVVHGEDELQILRALHDVVHLGPRDRSRHVVPNEVFGTRTETGAGFERHLADLLARVVLLVPART
jgi:hypothetical protein